MPFPKITPKTRTQATKLRHNSTVAELKLWTYLRSHRLRNIHFRRQHPIGKYIADFCAPRQKIIIEIDGSQHLERETKDNERSSFFETKGYRVLRFWNNEVMDNLDEVIIVIEEALSDK